MDKVFLDKGKHATREDGMCAMEYGAYLAGLPHTDSPDCVSPVLLEFMTNFNDSLDDVSRQLLRPYIGRTLGTAGDGQDERRSFMALDWLVRSQAPAFLDAAGLGKEASSLRGLPAIEGRAQAKAALPMALSAEAAATASYEFAEAAADAADGPALGRHDWNSPRAAASAVSRVARRSVSLLAGGAALAGAPARAAGRTIGWDTREPRGEVMRKSAFLLLERMIDPGGLHDVLQCERSSGERLGAQAVGIDA